MNRALFQYQIKAEPVSTSGESIFPDKWQGSAEVPRNAWARKVGVAAVVLAANTAFAWVPVPQATPDQWLPRLETPKWDIKREQFKYPSLFYADIPRAESVTIDRWHPEIEKPRWDSKRQQYTYPSSFLGDVPRAESVSVDRWHPSIEQPRITRASRIYDSGARDPYPIPNAAAVAFDWLIQNSDPVRPKPRIITGEQSFQITSFGENVTIDKWHTLDNVPRWDRVRAQFQFPSLFFLFTPETVTIDRWEPQLRYRLWGRARQEYLYDAGVSVVQIPQQAVTLDMWNPAQVYQRPRLGPPYWAIGTEAPLMPISGVHLPCILQACAVLVQPVDYCVELVQPVGYCAEEIACE